MRPVVWITVSHSVWQQRSLEAYTCCAQGYLSEYFTTRWAYRRACDGVMRCRCIESAVLAVYASVTELHCPIPGPIP
jgi:hypothetical protein